MKRRPIVVGNVFKSSSDQQYLVTECLGFGRGYWVVTIPCRTRQTIFKRNQLEQMRRVSEVELDDRPPRSCPCGQCVGWDRTVCIREHADAQPHSPNTL
jgi:hypothetical protein